MAVNEPRKGGAFLAVAGRVAAALIPFLIGAAGMAVLLNSGTSNLPSTAPGSGSNAPLTLPQEKVVVLPPASHKKPSHTRVARHAPPARTSAPQAESSATVKTQPVSRPLTQPRNGGKPSSRPPVHAHHGGGTGSGGGSSGSGGTGSGGETTTPPPPQVSTASTCAHPRGLALGHLKQQAKGLALGHEDKPCRGRGNVPPGLAVGHQGHVPPGQARKADNQQGGNGVDRGGDDEQVGKSSSDCGHGKDHGNGKDRGNGNGHGSHGRDHGG